MKLSLFIASTAIASAFAYHNAHALTCGKQPSCADLGYTLTTKSDCVGTALKCPFEDKYNCVTKPDIVTHDTPTNKSNAETWWYKDEISGLIFQGGKLNIDKDEIFSVTFSKIFNAAPITVLAAPYNQTSSNANDRNYVVMPLNITSSSFKIRYFDTDKDDKYRQGWVSWMAIGY